MSRGPYAKEEIEHIADVYVASRFNMSEALRRLEAEQPPIRMRFDTLSKWIHKGTHDFPSEIQRAVERAQRRAVVDPISATELMIGDVQDRLETYRVHHTELVAQAELKESAKVNRDVIKLEEHLRQTYEFLYCLKNPKEGQAAQQAVIVFVQMLVNRASPAQRDAIVAVATKLLPENALRGD